MSTAFEHPGDRQQQVLHLLLRHKAGLGVDAIGRELAISRNAVRQHLAALERDGLVRKGAAKPSGGRPEQLYVLTPRSNERFPRQYSWFAELLLGELPGGPGETGLKARLAALGRKVAQGLAGKLGGEPGTPQRVAALAAAMNDLGYDAASEGLEIEAYNCVFHNLAAANPDVCAFDLALLSACGGASVEHRSCMVRGGNSCRFGFSGLNARTSADRPEHGGKPRESAISRES